MVLLRKSRVSCVAQEDPLFAAWPHLRRVLCDGEVDRDRLWRIIVGLQEKIANVELSSLGGEEISDGEVEEDWTHRLSKIKLIRAR